MTNIFVKNRALRVLALFLPGLLIAAGAGCGGTKETSTPTTSSALSLSPSTVEIDAGTSQQFLATTPDGPATTVRWSVNDVDGGNSSVGTINSAGLYTAPGSLNTDQTFTVVATSINDSALRAS